jgi:hypothetical protein
VQTADCQYWILPAWLCFVRDHGKSSILTLQGEKAAIAKAALDGGDMAKANKLSMKDLLYLFRGDGGKDQ